MTDSEDDVSIDSERTVSPEFQALWDASGVALDAYDAVPPQDIGQRRVKMRALMQAYTEIFKYVHRIEQLALNDPSRYPGT
jgi:hypothetical protein